MEHPWIGGAIAVRCKVKHLRSLRFADCNYPAPSGVGHTCPYFVEQQLSAMTVHDPQRPVERPAIGPSIAVERSLDRNLAATPPYEKFVATGPSLVVAN